MKILKKFMNKTISKYIQLLVISFIPIFVGPVIIHLGGSNEKYLIVSLGVIVCIIAIIMIFISIFGIINELFKK